MWDSIQPFAKAIKKRMQAPWTSYSKFTEPIFFTLLIYEIVTLAGATIYLAIHALSQEASLRTVPFEMQTFRWITVML